jgi:hypothetical protein
MTVQPKQAVFHTTDRIRPEWPIHGEQETWIRCSGPWSVVVPRWSEQRTESSGSQNEERTKSVKLSQLGHQSLISVPNNRDDVKFVHQSAELAFTSIRIPT